MKPDIYTFCTRRDLISTVQLFNMRFWNHVELKIIPEQHPATNKVQMMPDTRHYHNV